MGIVSKNYLIDIIKKISHSTQVMQWRNTTTIIDWFKQLQSNKNLRFVKFDIVDFYPSISEQLLDRSIAFAKSITNIDEKVIDIII